MLLTRRQLVLLIILTFVWGMNWPIMKLALSEIPPLHYRTITMAGGCVIMIAWLLFKGYSLKVSLQDFIKIFWLALPNMVAWHTFSIFGVTELPPGRASILGFTMPIWTALLGALILGQRLSPRIWTSIAAAAAAVGLLTYNELSHLMGFPIGIVWMQLAAICWAFGTILFGKIKPGTRIEVTTAWMLAISSIIVGLLAFFLEPSLTWDYSNKVWFTIFYGLCINFGVGQLIWFSMATSLPPTASAFSIMAIPLVSIFSAAIWLQEIPQATDLIAAAFIIVAIAGAVLGKRPAVLKKDSP